MSDITIKQLLALSTSLTLSVGLASPAFSQTTPGDRSGTPTAAGSGQSAVTTTNAPAPSAPATRRTSNGSDPSSADIIVTARRVEERLQDVPISITVFNQKQISDRDIVNATDLAAYTPSLSSDANFGPENSTFAIRGFVQDNGTSPSVGVYFADVVAPRGPTQGIQAGDGAGPGNFFDLQNVQVLKGPQGTLQGRNTTGGAILFVPQKPTSKFEGYVQGSYGNYNMKRIQGVLNIPLSDIARFRIAADHQERNGYLHNETGIGADDYYNVDYTAIRASLVVDLTPDLENYTIVNYSHSNTNGGVEKLIGCNPTGYNPVNPATGAGNFIGVFSCSQLASEKAKGYGFYDTDVNFADPKSLLNQWQIINTTTWRVADNLTIKNIASYSQLKDIQRTPLFGTDWSAATLPAVYSAFIFNKGIPQFTDTAPAPHLATANQSTATEELQFQGNALDDKLTYQGGIYTEFSNPIGSSGNESYSLARCTNIAALQCDDPLGAAFSNLLGFPPGAVTVGAVNYTVGRTDFRSLGVYSQATYKFTDKISLTGGIRYTSDRQRNTSVRMATVFPQPNVPRTTCTDITQTPSCTERLVEKSHKPTWLIDLDYKPTEDILVYAKYSRGYRAGGVFANAPADHRSFEPEKVDAYEAGVKTTLRGPLHGTFNFDGFYNNFTNQQLQLGYENNQNYLGTGFPAPASPTTAVLNAGKSRIYGAEVEASISPFHGFVLDVGYTYLNATIRKVNSAVFATTDPLYQVGFSGLKAGDPLELSPKNKVAITGTYTLPLDRSIGRIAVGATFVHTDKQLTNYAYSTPADVALYGANYGYVKATNLLNLNASWDNVAGYPIDLAAFATNVTNKKYYSFIPGLGGVNGAGAEFAVIGQPRFFGGSAKYHF